MHPQFMSTINVNQDELQPRIDAAGSGVFKKRLSKLLLKDQHSRLTSLPRIRHAASVPMIVNIQIGMKQEPKQRCK